MWKRTHSKLVTGAKKEDIWAIWTDVNGWHRWHKDLEYCTLEGSFSKGNHFMLKPKGAGAVKIVLTDIQEGVSFTDCTEFFGAKMYDTHTIEETKEGIVLTNTIRVVGPLQWVWVFLVVQNVAKTVPDDMEALIELLRGGHA